MKGESKQTKLLEILNRKDVQALTEAGISDLRVELDGSISGCVAGDNGMPTVNYLKNIRVNEGEIDYDLDHSVENVGAVI